MIPLVDVQVVTKFKLLFPTIPIKWAPTDVAEKMAASVWGPYATGEQTEETVQDHLAPFITVFRTNVEEDYTQANASVERHGFSTGKYYADPANSNIAKALVVLQHRKAVVASYEVNVWTRKELERLEIARKISLANEYLPVLPQFNEQEYRFLLEPDPPSYTQGDHDKTWKLLWYSVLFPYRVRTYWLQDEAVRTILSIHTDLYAEMVSGDDITTELLDSVIITTDDVV